MCEVLTAMGVDGLDDTDTDANATDMNGWYFYLSFTAVKVPYSETP